MHLDAADGEGRVMYYQLGGVWLWLCSKLGGNDFLFICRLNTGIR